MMNAAEPGGAAATVRMLAAADWAALKAARLSALAEAPHAFASTLERELAFTEDTWRDRAGSGLTFGAWQGGTIVGLVTGLPEGQAAALPEGQAADWHLVGMWVSQQVRGSGIGDQLVGAVCARARKAGAANVTLWVTEVNGRARAFYRRLGFVPTGGRQLVRPDEPDHWEEELALRLD
jgi:ribosomal protein S18 acetylase RimI-like enzyme